MSLSHGLLGFYRIQIHKLNRNAIKAEQIVFRAVIKQSWWENDTDTPKFDVFYRKVKEEDLSLLTETKCDVACDGGFKDCYGEVGLKAKNFIIRGFKVIATPRPNVPQHASVYDMPPETEEIARSLALELVGCVTYKKRRRYKTKK